MLVQYDNKNICYNKKVIVVYLLFRMATTTQGEQIVFRVLRVMKQVTYVKARKVNGKTKKKYLFSLNNAVFQYINANATQFL